MGQHAAVRPAPAAARRTSDVMKCVKTKMMEATQLAWTRASNRVCVVSSEFPLRI